MVGMHASLQSCSSACVSTQQLNTCCSHAPASRQHAALHAGAGVPASPEPRQPPPPELRGLVAAGALRVAAIQQLGLGLPRRLLGGRRPLGLGLLLLLRLPLLRLRLGRLLLLLLA